MRVLVTGANGFVGSAVTRALVDAAPGIEIVAAVRRLININPALFEQVVVGDLAEPTHWMAFLKGVHVVVHCAARVHVMNESFVDRKSAYTAANVHGTLNLAKQAAATGVSRFVFLSSVKVNGECTQIERMFSETDLPNPQDAYGQSKYEAEVGLRRVAEETGMEVVIIRPPLVYGPRVKANFAALMKAVQHGWPLPLGVVRNQRSMVALDNLVDFIRTCATHPQAGNQTFMVSDGHDLSTAELVQGLARASVVPARLFPVPVWVLKAAAALLGKSDAVQRLCGNLQVDISKARNLLDWVPPVSVEEGLRRTVAGRDDEANI